MMLLSATDHVLEEDMPAGTDPGPCRRYLRIKDCAVMAMLVVGLVGLAVSASVVHARTITVTTTADSGPGSLRQALEDAAPGDMITFSVTGAITNTYTIDKPLTVRGPGTSDLIVGAFKITAGTEAAIADLVISDTIPDNYCGGDRGITNAGTLTLANSTVTGKCVSFQPGGGIHNTGTLTITNSTIAHNGTTNFAVGCGATGGGIYNSGTLRLVNSSVYRNHAEGGGGIDNAGALTVINTTITHNGANGCFVRFSGQLPGRGGGIGNSGTLDVLNSTITDNIALSSYSSDAKAAGIDGTAALKNTILARNRDQNGRGIDCSGTIVSQGYNLIQTPTDCTITGNTTGNITGVDPGLGELRDNGGPTFTRALLPGSPAIDAGTNASCPATDQRGVVRPAEGNGDGAATCDIGAFELAQPYRLDYHVYLPLVAKSRP